MMHPARVWFEYHGKPTGKGRPRSTKSGVIYTPPATVAAERALVAAYRSAVDEWPEPTFGERPVRVIAMVLRRAPTRLATTVRRHIEAEGLFAPGRPDLDNIAKLVGDALNGVAWADDSQIVEWRIVSKYSDLPGLDVEIEAL